ncbi:MAG TPA: hypothetical protein VMS31_23260 [Pyrinomonadaceae bacterium]|nr:hypothetical protein [Pyrinomonadaceae bacterium]
MSKKEAQSTALADVAFYYPGPMWHSSDALKNLLLFFDGIALLVPAYMRNKPEEQDPVMVGPLRKAGLLHLLEPETLVDKSATQELAGAVSDLISSGAFDGLKKKGTVFHELSYSRLGFYGDAGLAGVILKELKKRKLARKSKDGVSIPMHPVVRSTILVLLAQILRPKGPALGFELSPATDRPQLVDALSQLLLTASPVSTGRVVGFDLETVAPDLSAVPLDEVLDFRKSHLREFREYARSVRQFIREVGTLPAREREKAFTDRQEQIRDLASDLKRTGWAAWKKPASFALTIAGAAWTLKTGNPLGALLAATGAAASAIGGKRKEVNAYSYLFQTRSQWG